MSSAQLWVVKVKGKKKKRECRYVVDFGIIANNNFQLKSGKTQKKNLKKDNHVK